jgi:hypothetical protein
VSESRWLVFLIVYLPHIDRVTERLRWVSSPPRVHLSVIAFVSTSWLAWLKVPRIAVQVSQDHFVSSHLAVTPTGTGGAEVTGEGGETIARHRPDGWWVSLNLGVGHPGDILGGALRSHEPRRSAYWSEREGAPPCESIRTTSRRCWRRGLPR